MNSAWNVEEKCGRVVILTWGLMILFGVIGTAGAQTTTRVSLNQQMANSNGHSVNPTLSADGRYVAFESFASNLVDGDSNIFVDVYLYDRQAGITTRVSVNTEGGDSDGDSFAPALSADGRYLAFFSEATNLVPNDENDFNDVFLYDRQTGLTTRVSVNTEGGDSNGNSFEPALSADGRYVAFASEAKNLVPDDGKNVVRDVFVYDRQTGTISRVSGEPDGANANDASGRPALTPDGRLVAFQSSASNLVEGVNGGIFVYDQQTGETTLGLPFVSVFRFAMSADGRFFVFQSSAASVFGEGSGFPAIFVYDRKIEMARMVSVNMEGGDPNGVSFAPAVSADGRYVSFSSNASNLVANDENGIEDVFVYDQQTGITSRVSVNVEGGDPDGQSGSIGGGSFRAPLTTNGRYVAFSSDATNLVAGDANEFIDIFIVDRGPGVAADSGLSDVNGDGIADLVWRNTLNGATAVWLMNADGQRENATFPGGAGLEWVIRGVRDVDGNGPADLVWRNNSNGATAIWRMNSSGTRDSASFPGGAGLGWAIQDVGDVNNDGYADVIWRNTNSGATAVWLMNQASLRQGTTFPGGAGLEWVIQGVGDVNGDGTADLVWRNTNNGATATWLMNDDGLRQGTTFPGGASLSWTIRGIDDVNGDGVADLIWRDSDSGTSAVWIMNFSGTRQSVTFPGGAGPDWVIQHVGDVNGDSRADLIWRHVNDGATAVWLMNADGQRENATFPGGALLAWELRP